MQMMMPFLCPGLVFTCLRHKIYNIFTGTHIHCSNCLQQETDYEIR